MKEASIFLMPPLETLIDDIFQKEKSGILNQIGRAYLELGQVLGRYRMSTMIGEILTIGLMTFALSMDAFSIGLGMGMFQMRLRQIFRIGMTIGVFHVLMPLLGIIAGRLLSEKFGTIAGFVGGGLLILLGTQMLWSSMKKEEKSLITPVGFGLFIFAISASLDSFSVGLTLGIYGAKTIVALICFGIGATILTWTGLLIGRRVQGLLGSYSEALGGAILLAFGVKLLLSFI